MIYQCSSCGDEFETKDRDPHCPTCGADERELVIQPFTVLSETGAYEEDYDEE